MTKDNISLAQTEEPKEVKEKLSGWRGPKDRWNSKGRPVVLDKVEKPTNRQLREKAFMELVRKFRPHVAKAVNAAVGILENEDGTEQNKLRASALILQEYRTLLKDVYDKNYDEQEAEPMQQDSAAVFSLKVINQDDTQE